MNQACKWQAEDKILMLNLLVQNKFSILMLKSKHSIVTEKYRMTILKQKGSELKTNIHVHVQL